jgi:hypothetical protein
LNTGLNTKNFIQNIKNNATPLPAVVPQMTWYRTDDCLYVSNIRVEGDSLVWDAPASNLRYAVYRFSASDEGRPGVIGKAINLLGTSYTNKMDISRFANEQTLTAMNYAVAVLDRMGNEYPARTMDNTNWGKSAAARLEYPANNTEALLPCYCKWNAAPQADSYFFQLSKSADFATVDYEYETMDTTFFLGKIYWLESNETYYWRVRTRSINKEDTYSDIYSFSGSFFGIVSPASEDTVSLAPTIVCDSVATSDAVYTFEVATAQSMASDALVFMDITAAPRITLPEGILLASRNYYIRATVTFAGNTVVSDPIKVRTVALDVPVPEIISPANGETITGNTITVIWKEQASSGFQIQLSQKETFPNRFTKQFRTDYLTYSYTSEELNYGTWYIRVAGMKEGGLTEYSPVVKVTLTETTDVNDTHIYNQPIKTVEDGKVVIYRNGKRYTMLGVVAD